ncbi:hypothetical protein [Glycomyces terrestris]|uniref:hypothetical protein n=1 Tax=Glycomyces terrestris TaxID=2493553 RepID=UPI0013159296|nr:hypothetical protein [Glycomyces terrestris]
MHESALPQREAVDLSLLKDIVDTHDRSGPFALAQSAFDRARDWSPRDFAFAAKRLADAGYLDVQYGPGGFVRYVRGVSAQARHLVAGRPGRAAVPEPGLDALRGQLQDLLSRAARALQSEPDHPQAARWRAVLEAGLDLSPAAAEGAALHAPSGP